MPESLLLKAFIVGLISACSLPLGTLTTLVWRPSDRAVGIMMAFGGGALMAALTIDLVGSALQRGHFSALAIGCIIGGVIFFLLDKAVNNKGGFLRKSSTVVQYLRRKRRERFKRTVGHLGRLAIFQGLRKEDVEDLASAAISENFGKGATIYSLGDPSEFLYIVEEGEVTLSDPRDPEYEPVVVQAGSSFGRRAFVAGASHIRSAIATQDSKLWMLPSDSFDHALEHSAALAAATESMISGDEVANYLRKDHGLSTAQYDDWRDNAVAGLRGGGILPRALNIERHRDEFVRMSDGIRRIPIFRGLPPEELRAIAEKMFCARFERGDTIFRRHDSADRLFIVEDGQAALIDPIDAVGRRVTVEAGDAFGAMSFLTAARHSMSAVVTDDCTVWVLRKLDFDTLIRRFPKLHERVREYLEDAPITDYLEKNQGIEQEKIARWIKTATRNVDSGRLIPSSVCRRFAVFWWRSFSRRWNRRGLPRYHAPVLSREEQSMEYLHTMVRVTDLEKSLDFYCNQLGLVEVRRVDHEKGRFTLVFLAAPGDEDTAREDRRPTVELTYNWDPDEYQGGRNFGHLAYRVDDIYALCQKMVDAGTVINRPPRDGHMAFVRSPDGISIELLQKGESLPPREPWASMENTGAW